MAESYSNKLIAWLPRCLHSSANDNVSEIWHRPRNSIMSWSNYYFIKNNNVSSNNKLQKYQTFSANREFCSHISYWSYLLRALFNCEDFKSAACCINTLSGSICLDGRWVDGWIVGTSEGSIDGCPLGLENGWIEGRLFGWQLGHLIGCLVGWFVGRWVGWLLG